MKPERNDPCPCGSGKKYKKCCGANVSQQPAVAPAVLSGQAVAAFERGDFAASIRLSRQILQTDPSSAQANHILGLSLTQTRQLRPAITHLEKALLREPHNPFLLNNLAFACHGSGDLVAAERYARKAMEADAQLSDAHNNLGQILIDAGKTDAAIAAYRQAVALQPEHAVFHYNLGAALHLHKNERAEAERCYRQALARKQDFAPALSNLGTLLLEEEHWSEARELLERALELTPDDPKTLNSLGLALQRLKDEEGALRCFRRAIEVAAYPPAYSNLGVLLETRGDTEEAINSFRKVLAKHPEMQGVTANLFKLLYRCERYEAAYELVINTPVLDSIRFSFRALYITILQRMCDYDRLAVEWPIAREFFQQRFSELDQGYSDDLRNSTADVLNVLLLPMNYGNSFPETEIFRFHSDWGRLTAAPDEEICVDNKPPVGGRNQRIRIGYMSPDFRNHPVGYFMRHIIGWRDHARFETYCYSNSVTCDSMTDEFQRTADHFIDVSSLSDKELINRIQADGIDILIELAAHTHGSRLLVFSRRPAPVQVAYLGYPNTTGAKYIDYWITDPYAHAAEDEWHTEKLLRLPESFLCFGALQDRPRASRPPAGTNGYLTFGSFNNLRKLSADTIRLWSALMLAVPDSRLLLKDGLLQEKHARTNLLAAFRKQGIGSDRLRFEGRVSSHEAHLDLYNEMDLALDPVPYNGATTTCEALWMGVPVLTLVGTAHRQRVSFSLLKNIGIEETIAFTEREYAAIAQRLAGDLQSLQDLRERVATNVRASILCAPERFTRQFEAALSHVWGEYCSNNGRTAALGH
jgi:protein O-GlcNAc transferase